MPSLDVRHVDLCVGNSAWRADLSRIDSGRHREPASTAVFQVPATCLPESGFAASTAKLQLVLMSSLDRSLRHGRGRLCPSKKKK